MAYVIGLLTAEEKRELERRGWDLEPAPAQLVPRDMDGRRLMAMVWVDSSMFDIMSGPDWDRGEESDDDDR